MREWMVCVVLMLAACGDDAQGSGPTRVPSDYCDRFATQCGVPATPCHNECDGEMLVDGMPSDCWEYACSVFAMTCGEDPASDLAGWQCLRDHQVSQACSYLEDECLFCGADAPDRCNTVPTSNDEAACADLLVTMVHSADGCTD